MHEVTLVNFQVAPQLELLKQEPDPDVVKYNRKKFQQQQQQQATAGEPNGVFPPAGMMMPRMPPPGMMPPGQFVVNSQMQTIV